jgi:hypothetical protein
MKKEQTVNEQEFLQKLEKKTLDVGQQTAAVA